MTEVEKVDFERRKHPTYDREMFRHVLTSVCLISAIAIAALERTLGSWAMAAGLSGFLAGVAFLVSKPINTCLCAVCRSRLIREPCSAEFVCATCHITWTTWCRGESIADSFLGRRSESGTRRQS